MENQIGFGVGRLQREHSPLDKGTWCAEPEAGQTWLVFGEQQEALGMEKTISVATPQGICLPVCQVWWYLILSVCVLPDKKSIYQGVNSAFL